MPGKTALESSRSRLPFGSEILYQMLLFGLMFGTIFIQNNLVYPLEVSLLQDHLVNLVSLVYLPHGVKVICAILAGPRAIMPIFVANMFGFLSFGLTPAEAAANSFISTFCVFLPLVLFNYLKEYPLLSAPPISQSTSINLFRTVMVLAFMATLINAISRSTLYAENGFDLLAFRYVFGDMVGTIVILVLLLVLKKVLITAGRYIS